MAAALINVPKKAKNGDVIEIKTLMSHIMETGYRERQETSPRYFRIMRFDPCGDIASRRRFAHTARRLVAQWRRAVCIEYLTVAVNISDYDSSCPRPDRSPRGLEGR